MYHREVAHTPTLDKPPTLSGRTENDRLNPEDPVVRMTLPLKETQRDSKSAEVSQDSNGPSGP